MTPDEVRRAFEDWAAGLDPEAPVLEIREGFECSYRMWLAEGAPPFPEEASG